MNVQDAKLTALLRKSRATPAALPPRFRENVWRRIEDAEAPARAESWLDSLAALILRPRLALAVAAGLLVAGVLAGAMEGWEHARQDARMNYLAAVAPHSAR